MQDQSTALALRLECFIWGATEGVQLPADAALSAVRAFTGSMHISTVEHLANREVAGAGLGVCVFVRACVRAYGYARVNTRVRVRTCT